MDTSKEYIKMCEEAEEIQKEKHCVGDWVNHLGGTFVHGLDGECVNPLSNEPIIWLPRQDQLQKMVKSPEKNNFDLICNMEHFIYDGYGRVNKKMSMEQLWLAFVMNEKYGKVWNETEWTKP